MLLDYDFSQDPLFLLHTTNGTNFIIFNKVLQLTIIYKLLYLAGTLTGVAGSGGIVGKMAELLDYDIVISVHRGYIKGCYS